MTLQQHLDSNLIIQYSIVGVILLAACVWIAVKVFRRQKNKSQGSCCGCSLSDACKKKDIINHSQSHHSLSRHGKNRNS